MNHRHAQFVQEVILGCQKPGTGLALGPAVNIYDDGAFPGEFGGRFVEPPGNLFVIKTFPPHKFRFREIPGVDTSRLAGSPAVHFPALHVQRISVDRIARGLDSETEVAIVLMPFDAAHRSGGQFGRGPFLPARCVEQMQNTQPVFVDNESDHFSVPRQLKPLDVPFDVVGEIGMFLRRQIDVGQALKLRVPVGRRIDAFVIFAELRGAVENLARLIFRREGCPVASGDVDQPKITFIGGDLFGHQQLAFVGRNVQRTPAAALKLCQQPVGFRLGGIDHPQIHVLAVAPRRAIDELVA